jgi:hypothetical protein
MSLIITTETNPTPPEANEAKPCLTAIQPPPDIDDPDVLRMLALIEGTRSILEREDIHPFSLLDLNVLPDLMVCARISREMLRILETMNHRSRAARAFGADASYARMKAATFTPAVRSSLTKLEALYSSILDRTVTGIAAQSEFAEHANALRAALGVASRVAGPNAASENRLRV